MRTMFTVDLYGNRGFDSRNACHAGFVREVPKDSEMDFNSPRPPSQAFPDKSFASGHTCTHCKP